MALPSDAQSVIERLINHSVTHADCITEIRRIYPGLATINCDASDMGMETPWFETGQFQVFLLDTREHCTQLTSDPLVASGLVLARKARGTA